MPLPVIWRMPGCAVVALGFDRDQVTHPLDGFGVLNPTSEGRRLLGVLWTSSIFRDRAPAGSVLLRCMAGGARDPGFLAMADDELVALCLAEAAADLRIRGRPQHHWIFRHRQAIAQYEVGHLARLAAISAVLAAQPGLFLTGSSYRGISVNHCLAEAERSAVQILAWLARRAGLQQIAPDGTAALPAPGSIGSLAARNGG
jgi:oxygen-dependent protoporphyrinogen oxidase